MTEQELIQKLGLILGKSEMEVKTTPYVTLLREMVEEFMLNVNMCYYEEVNK